MSPFITTRDGLARFRPDWLTAMPVADVAQWIINWLEPEAIVDLYVDATAKSRVINANYMHALPGRDASRPHFHLAATKLANAAYVALEPEVCARLVASGTFKKRMAKACAEAQAAHDERAWAILGLLVVFDELMFPRPE